MKDPEAVAAALQLLLGDLPDEQKRALFYKAFPDSFILVKGDSKQLYDWIRAAKHNLDASINRADGTSPMGVLAVKNLHADLVAARSNIRTIAGIFGIPI